MKAPKISIQIGADTKKLKRDMKNADGIVSKFTTAAKFGLAGVASAAGAAAFTLGVEGVKAASDLGESVSKTNVIFGETAASLQKWAETNANMMGQTQQQALDAASTFATFGKAAGLQGTRLLKFSEKLTVLASDLASFYNTDPADAIQALGAALRGESEPIRRYGVLLSDAAQKEEALAQGMEVAKSGLTAQQKVMTAYALILKQTKDAQGDFARTQDGLANGTRILEASMHDATLAVGNALLPTIQELVGFINSPDGKLALQTGANGLADALTSMAESLPKLITLFKNMGTILDNITPDPDSPIMKLLELGGRPIMETPGIPTSPYKALMADYSPPNAKNFAERYPSVNITINGAVDPGATGRQVKKILNQTQLNAVSPNAGDRRR